MTHDDQIALSQEEWLQLLAGPFEAGKQRIREYLFGKPVSFRIQ